MAPRASWRGVLKVADIVCPVALHAAASTAERIAFHILNRKTGHRVHRQFVDAQTEKPVAAEDQVKGYQTPQGELVLVEPEEIAAAIPESDKTLDVEAFVACDAIDTLYLDRPYYLTPAAPDDAEAYGLLREEMQARKVAALARTVLFRRMRTLLIRPQGEGFIADTLNFDHEVGSPDEAFADIPKPTIAKEMLDLARHIIDTKMGAFDPAAFDDRYEAALADLVKAKLEGRKITPPKPRAPTGPSDLLEALRRSAGAGTPPRSGKAGTGARSSSAPRRKAG